MIKKGNVISNALLMLGEVRNYNNNNYEMYKIAMQMLESVLNDVGANPSFRANALETKLTLAKKDNGRYYYNIPIDMLSVIKSYDDNNQDAEYEIIGEYIVSPYDDLRFAYCRAIPIEDYPNYYNEYLSLCLAEKLAEAFDQYNKKLQYVVSKKQKEAGNIAIIEAVHWRKYI